MTTQNDDPLSYDIPDEPSVDHLARVIITDFAVYETVDQTVTPEDNPISALLTEASPTSLYDSKQQMLRGYVNGSNPASTAVKTLRWAYKQELDALEVMEAQGGLDALATRRTSYLRKLLAQPDDFFVRALETARPALSGLSNYNGAE